jgi:hypothetical protein
LTALPALRRAVEGLRREHEGWCKRSPSPHSNPDWECGADAHNARVDEVLGMIGEMEK